MNKLYSVAEFCFSERCSGNHDILFYDLTFVNGLKQNSCKNSENLLELIICLKNITCCTLMNKSVYSKLFKCHVCDYNFFVHVRGSQTRSWSLSNTARFACLLCLTPISGLELLLMS